MEYLTPAGFGEAELVEKKSRFIGRVWPVETEEEIREILEKIRKEHWDASHNVYAYRVGLSPEIERFSDDGEPGGTSGLPTLTVLKGADVHNVLVITTRYFGGTLLGTGGLVRAYSEAAKLALEAAGIAQRQVLVPFTLKVDYTLLGKLQYVLAKASAPVLSTEFTEAVELRTAVPLTEKERFVKRITEETEGRIVPEADSPVWGSITDGKCVFYSDSLMSLPENA